MATFVLVPGGFHGAWCYSEVAMRLRKHGHIVHTPFLSGVGELSHLAGGAINLSTQIEDVAALIRAEDLSDIILCGHSYGGLVITGVAGQVGERIKTLFYLDASVPEDGQSLLDVVGQETAIAILQLAGDTGVTVSPMTAVSFGVKPENAEMVDRLSTPHPIGCFIQKLRFTGKEALVPHRTYVLAERFQSVTQSIYERVRRAPGWKVASIDCGHDIMIDAPQELVDLLLQETTR